MTDAERRFSKGDRVRWTDKFLQVQVGVLSHYETVPWGDGVKEVAVVIAQPFGPESGDVNCLVPESALRWEIIL